MAQNLKQLREKFNALRSDSSTDFEREYARHEFLKWVEDEGISISHIDLFAEMRQEKQTPIPCLQFTEWAGDKYIYKRENKMWYRQLKPNDVPANEWPKNLGPLKTEDLFQYWMENVNL